MHRSVLIAAAITLLFAVPALAQDAQPSFDCAKAATPVEHAICSNETLSQLDSDLAGTYTKALAHAADAEALRNEQRAWSAQRAAACGILPGADDDMPDISDAANDCLVDIYMTRITALNQAVTAAGAAPDPARLLTGLWQIAEVITAADPALTKPDQKGRLIRLNRHSLASLDGAGCAGPTLQPLNEARGRPLDADEQALLEKADAANKNGKDGIAGFCLGRLFALYLPAEDGSLLVADASALYRLQRLSGNNSASGTP